MKKLAIILCAAFVFNLNADVTSIAEQDLRKQEFTRISKRNTDPKEFHYALKPSEFEHGGVIPTVVAALVDKDDKYKMIALVYKKENLPKITKAISSKFTKNEKIDDVFSSKNNVISISCSGENTGVIISRKSK
jgi:hypothetical protein